MAKTIELDVNGRGDFRSGPFGQSGARIGLSHPPGRVIVSL